MKIPFQMSDKQRQHIEKQKKEFKLHRKPQDIRDAEAVSCEKNHREFKTNWGHR